MNKYNLIHTITGEKHVCDKVIIDNDDYYVAKADIQVGDWLLYSNPVTNRTSIVKCTTVEKGYFDYVRQTLDIKECPIKWAKKIILTTDQNLVNDGVQAIDDEFLHWFVQNSDCEYVEITLDWDNDQIVHTPDMKFKIIIPPEQPTHDYSGVHLTHCYQGEYEDGCKYGDDDCSAKPEKHLTQETLEEAAENYASKIWNFSDSREKTLYTNCKKAFLEGAKWQATQIYTEEEIHAIIKNYQNTIENNPQHTKYDDWFKQFKK